MLLPGRPSFWRRFAAYLIDQVLVQVVTLLLTGLALGLVWVLGRALGRITPEQGFFAVFGSIGLQAILVVMSQIVSFAYQVAFVVHSGQTPGKQWLGLQVVACDGGPVSLGRAVSRYVMAGVSSIVFLTGYLMAVFHPRGQSLHELVSGTETRFRV